MQAKMRALCRCRAVVALLFILAVMLSAVGCATSSPGSYRSSFQGTSEPKVSMRDWKIEHNLLNSRYQKLEKEAWEDDSSG